MKLTAYFTTIHHSLEPLEARIAPATFMVTSLADDGSDGTLRHEIGDANSAGGKNTIVFKGGLHGTVTLNSGALEIAFTDLTIKGPGGNKIILQGESDRIFVIDGHSVTLSGLALIGGSVTGNGGAITSTGSLAIINCTIAGSTATNGSGGAIYDKTDGTFLLKNSVITGNSAASSGSGTYDAGGVYAEADGGIAIINSKIIGNTASGNDGGLQLQQFGAGTGDIVISGSLISGNSASNGAGGGLAINEDSFHGSQVKISSSVVSGNTATNGAGGIYLQTSSSKAATITGVVISNNSGGTASGISGGGMEFIGLGQLIVQGSQIIGNTAGIGGGIFANSGLTISNSKILNNQATNYGGGVDVFGANFLLSHSTVSGNAATNSAGGLEVSTNGDQATKIIGSTISQNTAGTSAGGAYLEGGSAITIISSAITGNVAKSGNAGGLDINSNSANILLQNNTIADNAALSADPNGGGVDLTGSGTFKIIGGTITGNLGGGIYVDTTPTVLIQGTLITGNQDVGFDGGGFSHAKNATGVVTITKPSLITGNIALYPAKADTYGAFTTP
jgi:hypothetical protein